MLISLPDPVCHLWPPGGYFECLRFTEKNCSNQKTYLFCSMGIQRLISAYPSHRSFRNFKPTTYTFPSNIQSDPSSVIPSMKSLLLWSIFFSNMSISTLRSTCTIYKRKSTYLLWLVNGNNKSIIIMSSAPALAISRDFQAVILDGHL